MGLVNNDTEISWTNVMNDILKDATTHGSKKSVLWVSSAEVYDIVVTRRPSMANPIEEIPSNG